MIYVLGQAILSEITPVSQRGAMLALNSAIYTTAGILAPYVMGSSIQNASTRGQGYIDGFVTCGIITLVSGFIGICFMRPGEEIKRFSRRNANLAFAPAE